jgi:amidase
MMNGTSVLEGYGPYIDATLVTRILGADGEIGGKADCESPCFPGGSHTSDNGPTLSPYDPSRTTGGSSTGSAALLAAVEVDMAIGGDQGGSIRIPAAWCGMVGPKPTHGLVPYTGTVPIEATLDHPGPITRSAADCAPLLDVIAGEDGLDPRQVGPKGVTCTRALAGDVTDPRIGMVRERFSWEGLTAPNVDAAVRKAAACSEALGAEVLTVSIPWHCEGRHIWTGIAVEGATQLTLNGNSMGTNCNGHYTTSPLNAFARGWRTRLTDLSETTKVVLLTGEDLQQRTIAGATRRRATWRVGCAPGTTRRWPASTCC